MEEVFPTQRMQAIVASIEDAESRWDERNGGYHPQMEAIGLDLVRSLGELIVAVGAYRDRVDEQVRQYARRKVTG